VLILALDTCDSRGSVAVLKDSSPVCAVTHDTPEDYSSWLLPAVHDALQSAGSNLAQVELYAAASGPGSFTGLRVGLTSVKAWSEIYGRPIAAVSRLDALISQADSKALYIAAFTDAQRGQLFGALYRHNGSILERVEDEMVIAPENFVAWASERADSHRIDWISTDPECIAASKMWAARRSQGETIQVIAPVLAPMIGKLGYQLALQGKLTDALALDANYVRRSDAEIFWKAKRSHAG